MSVKDYIKIEKKFDNNESGICIVKKDCQKKEKAMSKELSTTYLENLPSPTYKTRQFSRTITETLPDDVNTEIIEKCAIRQQKFCEYLVKRDIDRHMQDLRKDLDKNKSKANKIMNL